LADRSLLPLAASAAIGATALAYLLVWPSDGTGAGAASTLLDPLAEDLATAGAALTVPEPASRLRAQSPGGRLAEGLYAIGAARLRVRLTDGQDATALADAERTRVLALFEEHQAPYPGALSTSLRCPEALRPAALPDLPAARFALRLFANERLAYGGCADDLLRYRASYGAFVDAAGERLIRVEYFDLRDAADVGAELLRSFRWNR